MATADLGLVDNSPTLKLLVFVLLCISMAVLVFDVRRD